MWHFSQPRCHSANRFSRTGMTCFVAQSVPDGLLERHNATLGLLVRFIRRLAFSRGLGIWDLSSRLQWSHNSCQTHAGNSPGNSVLTPPDLQALERGRRHFGARGGNHQDGAGARPPLGRRPKNQVPHTTVGLLVRLVRRLAVSGGRQVRHVSLLGLWNHSSRLQWGKQRRQNSCWQPFWKQWQHAFRPTGSGMWSTTFRGMWRVLPRWCKSSLPKRPGFWWKASRRAICRFPRASPKSSSTARTSSSRRFCSSWRCSGSTSATRHGSAGEGSEAHETRQAAAQGLEHTLAI